MVDILLATGTSRRKAGKISNERLINFFVQSDPPSAREPASLTAAYGISTFATIPNNGPIRGMHFMGGVLYAVSDESLYSVSSTGTVTYLGGGIIGTGPVSMDDNGTHLTIVNGFSGFVYSVSSGYAPIGDADFQNGAKTVTNLDGFATFDWAGTNKVFVSDLLNATAYSSLAFAAEATKSDLVLAVRNIRQRLMILKQRSIVAWANAGLTNFPFERIPGAVAEHGVIGSYAHCPEDDTMFFIGEDRVAYRMIDVAQHERISNHAAEEQWSTYAKVDDAFMFSYRYAGHGFVVVTFPTEPATWVFDTTVGQWHERTSIDSQGNLHDRWRVNCAISGYSKVLVGDELSGKIGYINGDVFTEFGDPIHGTIITPVIHGKGNMVFQESFELDLDAGRGLISGQGSTPQVMLDVSDDGGQTWTGPQLWRSAGAAGQHKTKLIWGTLGSFYDRALKITVSDPVRWTISAGRGEFSAGV